MADYRTTIHHDNFTAVGRGWNVTAANLRAVGNYLNCNPNESTIDFVQKLANEARSCRRGGIGETRWRLDRDKSFVIIERV